jgi:hypothetical protein
MYTPRRDEIRFSGLSCLDRPAHQSSGALFLEGTGQSWWCRSRRCPLSYWLTAVRTAEDGLVPKPRMQRIGLARLCRLTRERRRLARRYRAPLICHAGVHHAGTPISEHVKMPDAARNPTSSEPASA